MLSDTHLTSDAMDGDRLIAWYHLTNWKLGHGSRKKEKAKHEYEDAGDRLDEFISTHA